ncbi:hypothetical protein RB600_007715 [Gaeumannomyces tritici]
MSMVEGKISSCCLTGFEWDGTPTGRTEKLGGSDVYVAGANAEAGVLLVHDLFGWTFGNLSLLADQVAREADVTVYMPDLVAAGRFRDLDLPGFMARNGRASREPELFACARAIRAERGHSRVSACLLPIGVLLWRLGWPPPREHRAAPLVDGISIGHPSLATEKDFDEVAVPVQILAPPPPPPPPPPRARPRLHARAEAPRLPGHDQEGGSAPPGGRARLPGPREAGRAGRARGHGGWQGRRRGLAGGSPAQGGCVRGARGTRRRPRYLEGTREDCSGRLRRLEGETGDRLARGRDKEI